jgi:hypothetical protein
MDSTKISGKPQFRHQSCSTYLATQAEKKLKRQEAIDDTSVKA